MPVAFHRDTNDLEAGHSLYVITVTVDQALAPPHLWLVDPGFGHGR